MSANVPLCEEQFVQTLQRGALFRALSLGFSYPDPMLLDRLRISLNELMQAPAPWPASLKPCFAQVAALIPGLAGEELESHYLRLFGPAGTCHPLETAFGDAGRLLGKSAILADISGFYLAFGLQLAPGSAHPEDHLCFELEYLGTLAFKEAYARAEGWAEQAEITVWAQTLFIKEHLGTWAESFRDRLGECAPPPFYLALGEALHRTVEHEILRLEVSPLRHRGRVVDLEMGGETLSCPMVPLISLDPPQA